MWCVQRIPEAAPPAAHDQLVGGDRQPLNRPTGVAERVARAFPDLPLRGRQVRREGLAGGGVVHRDAGAAAAGTSRGGIPDTAERRYGDPMLVRVVLRARLEDETPLARLPRRRTVA